VTIEKYIKKRSGGNCEHPNCGKAGEHIHHIEPFALTKTHDPDRMLHLCKGHHRIIHMGYIDDGEIWVGWLEELRRKQWKRIEKLPSMILKILLMGGLRSLGCEVGGA
jgi:hypothetical protein